MAARRLAARAWIVGAAILVCGIALQPLGATTPSTPDDPSVSILLPPSIPSDHVQIAYELIGPFGGYITEVGQQPGVPAYEITASVSGKAATEIRMVVYASGCEIQTYVFRLKDDSKIAKEFECMAAPAVPLSGRIEPADLVKQNQNAEVVVRYSAFWVHEFFNIVDGMVTEFQVAVVRPNADGTFQVELPYFSADAADTSSRETRAAFWLLLRDSKTLNPIAFDLMPEARELRSEEMSLQIEPQYPTGLVFTPESQ